MMWWGVDGSWANGWGWVGILLTVVFAIFCLRMIVHMMGGMMGGHGHARPWPRELRQDARPDTAERILADRLARGEIDVEEYERLLAALQRPAGSTRA